jgi:hypothetical protein
LARQIISDAEADVVDVADDMEFDMEAAIDRVIAVLREVDLEGVYLRGEAGDPGLIGAVGQAVTVYQLSPNICARPSRPGRKR